MQMHHARARTALGIFAATIAAGGLFAAQAGAHARVSPSLTQLGTSNVYTLVVPTESETATTTEVEMTVPAGFSIGTFEAIPGVKREVVAEGTGDEATISKVTWTGLDVPSGEGAFLRFSGRTEDAGDFKFLVTQTYSDGKVSEWTGTEDSDSPAPIVSVVDSLGAAGGDQAATSGEASDDDGGNTTGTIALILAILALLLGLAGLVRRGSRSLT
jgi:uncharacterized protein YcnI